MKLMLKNYFFVLIAGFLASCEAPIVNAQGQGATTKTSAISGEGENLLKAYGCPNAFGDIPLCVRVQWFDDKGVEVAGPIYWQRYRDHSMSAKLYFWNAKDGWPVDPRTEFPEAKIIKLKLFMPTMGHGTMGHFAAVNDVKNRVGQFDVTNVRFVMGCDQEDPWDVRIQLKSAHADEDFDSNEEPESEPNVWKQSILKFTSIERR